MLSAAFPLLTELLSVKLIPKAMTLRSSKRLVIPKAATHAGNGLSNYSYRDGSGVPSSMAVLKPRHFAARRNATQSMLLESDSAQLLGAKPGASDVSPVLLCILFRAS